MPAAVPELSDARQLGLDRALAPERSAVVEACAGSGKTWLLVARMVRALLAGCTPGQLLAITYTRKAAGEIEERLRLSLRELATLDDPQALAFLTARGLDPTQAARALPKARCLFEELAEATLPPTITTFHGWFAATLGAAPLDTGWAGFRIVEASGRLRDEVWQLFGATLARGALPAAAESLLWLLEQVGLHSTRQLLERFLDRRAEWHAYGGGAALETVLERLAADCGIDLSSDPSVCALADGTLRAELAECRSLLERSGAHSDLAHAESIAAALAMADAQAAIDALAALFLTQKGEPRRKRVTKALERRLGAADARRLGELCDSLAQRCLEVQARRAELRAYRFSFHGLAVGEALLGAYDDFKRERQLMDFVDLECWCDRLLGDPMRAAFVQARLDARYKQILIDEFQDTNPLQWRILRAWLDAYGGAGYKPQVFIVGDPKQSIYRFRRAEPRLFAAAARFFADAFEAERVHNDVTRRNAPAIVAVVNQLFGAEPLFQPYRPQQALQTDLPGRVELLALAAREPAPPRQAVALRDPLRQARAGEEDLRRRGEARQVVERIRLAVGHWAVIEAAGQRALQYGDIMVLARRRRALVEIEAELRAVGIPYLSQRRGGLLDTLEAADLTALLRFLSTPADDLALAHALRAPALGASNDDLALLAAADAEASWWQRLQSCAAAPAASASPALRRAARLLSGWIDMAPRVPVHDLLDRIYAESDLVSRTRAAVPAAMWPGVAANLEAFIALALELDGGRFPSLPRFIDELKRRARGAEEDAPDEGLIASADEDGGRVRLLTVHGAKGLEAPLVFLLDAHSAWNGNDSYSALIDWPADADRPAHFSLVATKKLRGRARRALLDMEEQSAAREALNLLYVAMTRACQYFCASGIEAANAGARDSAYQRLRRALEALGDATCFGPPPPTYAPPQASSAPPQPPAMVASPASVPPPVGERRAGPSAAVTWGIRLHSLLQALSEAPDAAPVQPADIGERSWQALLQAAECIRRAPHLRRFLDASLMLNARNEVEFGMSDGRIGRIDRLVEFEHEVWILDYKSGRRDAASEADHRRQLDAYRSALAQIIPSKPLRCGLIYGDAELIEF